MGCLSISEIPRNASFRERIGVSKGTSSCNVEDPSSCREESSVLCTKGTWSYRVLWVRMSLHPAAESQRQGCRSSCGGRGWALTSKKQEVITCLRRLSTSGVKQISVNSIYIPYFKTFYESPCCCLQNAGCSSGFEGRCRSRIFKHEPRHDATDSRVFWRECERHGVSGFWFWEFELDEGFPNTL